MRAPRSVPESLLRRRTRSPWLAMLATAAALTTMSACAGSDAPEALLEKARQSLSSNEPRTAEIHLKNLLQTSENAEARFLLGGIYANAGDLPSAEKEYRRALDLGHDRERTLPALMATLLALGQPQRVLDLSHDLRLESPQARSNALSIAGNALLRLGKREEAAKTFDEAIALSADNVSAQVGAASVVAATDRAAARARVEKVLAEHPKAIDALSLLANLHIADGRGDAATDVLKKLIEIAPRTADAHLRLVGLALDRGDTEAARTYHAGLSKAAPGAPVTLYQKALIELRSGEPKAAKAAIDESLRKAPEYLPAVAVAAAVHLQLGELEQAERFGRQLVERAPNAIQGYRMLGATYLRMNTPDRALDTATRAIDRGARDPMLYAIAGEAALKTNDAEAATRYFEEAAKLDPKDPRKLTGLAMAQLATGDRDKAIDGLEEAVQLEGASMQTDIALISALMRDRKFDEALKAVDRMESRNPKSPVPAALRGAVFGAKGDEAGARKALAQALERDPKYFAAAANLANLDLRAGRPDDARKRYEGVLAADPRNAQARVALAILRARQGAPREEVLAILAKAREDNPGAAMPVLATARYMLETNTPREALPLLQAAVNADPGNTQVLDMLAIALVRSDQRAQAIATWERLLRVTPNAWNAHMRIAEVQRAGGENDLALASLRKASEIAPDAIEPKLARATLFVELKRYGDARRIADELKANERQATLGQVLDGDISVAEGKMKAAAEAYQRAFKISRTVPVAGKLMRALRADNRTAEAEKILRDWVAAQPKDPQVRQFAGEYEISQQRWKQAWEHYAIVIERQPDNPLVLNNAAWALHQLKDKRAAELARKAWEAAPRNAAILDTYGVILSESGDAKGVDLLRQAVAAAPTAAQIRLHYAEALARSGNKAEAKVEVETVLKAVPTGTLADRAKALAATL